MRCPKCGYISFDQQTECLKCSVGFPESIAAFTGTGLKVDKPFFLASVLEETSGEDSFNLSEAVTVNDGVSEDGEIDFSGPMSEEEISGDEELLLGDEGEILVMDELSIEEAEESRGQIEFSMDEDLGPKAEDKHLGSQFDEAFDADEDLSDNDSGVAGDAPELEGDIDFKLDEDMSGAEELEDLPELELDSLGDSGISMDDDEGTDVELEADEELEANEGDGAKAVGGLKLDIDVDIEDEPTDEDMVFNLEDIDMSDLVIEEDELENSSPEKSTEESALDLEGFLSSDEGLDDLPMDLSLDDGDLVQEDGSVKNKNDDLPEIEL